MIWLVDTSAWTHALRKKGDPAIRDRVQTLLLNDEACWCDVIRLELWQGCKSDADRQTLADMEENLKLIPVTSVVWDIACDLGLLARKKGLAVPMSDLVIFACATANKIPIEHNDQHFNHLADIVTPTGIPRRF